MERKIGCCLKGIPTFYLLNFYSIEKQFYWPSITQPTTCLADLATCGVRADALRVRECGRSFRQWLICGTEEAGYPEEENSLIAFREISVCAIFEISLYPALSYSMLGNILVFRLCLALGYNQRLAPCQVQIQRQGTLCLGVTPVPAQYHRRHRLITT